MIEIFSRDRGTDYELFTYQNGMFEYTTKGKNPKNRKLYHGLNRGTIILDGVVLKSEEITEEQIEYLKDVLSMLSSEVASYKREYKPVYYRYTRGANVSEMIANANVIEIPDMRKFKE